jgi:transposase-like protein
VTEALPERLRAAVRTAMNQAYATREAKRARRLLGNLARRLGHQHPGAAASLREGLDETLTVMRLELPDHLERVLSSTNLIENLFSRVREIGRRVRHWAERNYGTSLECCWRTRSRAQLPKSRGLSRHTNSRRRSAGSRCKARSSWDC